MKGPKEKLLYVPCIYRGTAQKKPDYLATIDCDPDSPTYQQVCMCVVMPYTLADFVSDVMTTRRP